jgi:hypothetical protein
MRRAADTRRFRLATASTRRTASSATNGGCHLARHCDGRGGGIVHGVLVGGLPPIAASCRTESCSSQDSFIQALHRGHAARLRFMWELLLRVRAMEITQASAADTSAGTSAAGAPGARQRLKRRTPSASTTVGGVLVALLYAAARLARLPHTADVQ